MTFTRAARTEALLRTGKEEKDFPFLRTIHSIAYQQLGIGRDQVARPKDILNFGKIIGSKMCVTEFDPWIEEYEKTSEPPTRDDLLLQTSHRGRHKCISLQEAIIENNLDIDYKYATWFMKAYGAWKSSKGLFDYTDLLVKYVEVGKPLDIDVMFVDESQDLSKLQWQVVTILGSRAKRSYFAGDDDQAIFHWAGADAEAFQDLKVDKTEVLSQSYRLSKNVHAKAMEVVGRIKKRLPKEYAPTEKEGSVKSTGSLETVDFSEKTFVLFRNHYKGNMLSNALRNMEIPFLGKGSPIGDPTLRAALSAWAYLIKQGEVDTILLKSFVKYGSRDYVRPDAWKLIKEKKTAKAEDVFFDRPQANQWGQIFEENLPNFGYVKRLIRRYGITAVAQPKTELLSIHQSKGREAHTVVIDPDITKAVWLGMMNRSDDEHRVWYVAVTRAKERVFVLLTDSYYSYKY